MGKKKSRSQARVRRHIRVRRKLAGTSERPRLNVFRSLTEIYAQVIDDQAGHTLVSASSIDQELRPQMDGLNKSDQARLVGKSVAERAKRPKSQLSSSSSTRCCRSARNPWASMACDSSFLVIPSTRRSRRWLSCS